MIKRILLSIALLTITVVAYAALNLPIPRSNLKYSATQTDQSYYLQINRVTADDTEPNFAETYWDNIDGDLGATYSFIPIPNNWNRVELSFYGYGDGTGVGDPNGATFTFKAYAARPGGNAKPIYQGAGTMGAAQLSRNPAIPTSAFRSGAADPNYTWCDTIAASGNGDEWPTTVRLSGEGGNDGVATVSFDFTGYWGLWVAITDMTAQSVTSVTCVATGW